MFQLRAMGLIRQGSGFGLKVGNGQCMPASALIELQELSGSRPSTVSLDRGRHLPLWTRPSICFAGSCRQMRRLVHRKFTDSRQAVTDRAGKNGSISEITLGTR